MSGESKSVVQRLFHACLLLLGAVVALNVAVALLKPVLPWLIGGFALVAVGWLTIAFVRWWRSKVIGS